MSLKDVLTYMGYSSIDDLKFRHADEEHGAIRRGEYFTGRFEPESGYMHMFGEDNAKLRRNGQSRRSFSRDSPEGKIHTKYGLWDEEGESTYSPWGHRLSTSIQDRFNPHAALSFGHRVDDEHVQEFQKFNQIIQNARLSREDRAEVGMHLIDKFIRENKATEYEIGMDGKYTGNYRRGESPTNEEYRRQNNIPMNARILAERRDLNPSFGAIEKGYNPRDVRFKSLESPKQREVASRGSYFEPVSGSDYVAMRDAARAERGYDNAPVFAYNNEAGQRYLGPNTRTAASMPREAVISGEDPANYVR